MVSIIRRIIGSASGSSLSPSVSAWKYIMVPPTSSGMRSRSVISRISASASSRKRAAE